MKKGIKVEIILLLITLGIFACFHTFWQVLEVFFYGEVQPNTVDTIIGFIIFYSFYFNAKSLLVRWWGNEE